MKRFIKYVNGFLVIPENKSNCSSKNFRAIADANLQMYTKCVEDGVDDE